MATARERRHLHDRLTGALGEEAAGTMVDVLEQMATKDDLVPLATRRDLEELEIRIGARFDREARRVGSEFSVMREGMSSMREDMASEFAAVRGDMSSMREAMSVQNGLLRQEMAALVLSRRTIVLTVIATLAALAAMVAGIVAVV